MLQIKAALNSLTRETPRSLMIYYGIFAGLAVHDRHAHPGWVSQPGHFDHHVHHRSSLLDHGS